MSDNMELWRRAFTTDPKAVKEITGKQYKGNSPKPYWIVQRLTQEFGPCGIGWGFSIISERFERFSDSDSLHIAAVRFWYVMGEKRGELEQIGQTKATYMSKDSKFIVDEDAPKKSVTDALVKCASYLGFAGDIFSGRWDDSKYVAQAAAEWAARRAEEAQPAAGMAPEIVGDWIQFINESANAGELKTRLKEAIAEATGCNDPNAIDKFTAAAEAKAATAKPKAAT